MGGKCHRGSGICFADRSLGLCCSDRMSWGSGERRHCLHWDKSKTTQASCLDVLVLTHFLRNPETARFYRHLFYKKVLKDESCLTPEPLPGHSPQRQKWRRVVWGVPDKRQEWHLLPLSICHSSCPFGSRFFWYFIWEEIGQFSVCIQETENRNRKWTGHHLSHQTTMYVQRHSTWYNKGKNDFGQVWRAQV